MKWYYLEQGGHTHIRVFMNGGKAGDLVLRNNEFKEVREHCPWISFLPERQSEKAPQVRCSCPSVACEIHGLPPGAASGGW